MGLRAGVGIGAFFCLLLVLAGLPDAYRAVVRSVSMHAPSLEAALASPLPFLSSRRTHLGLLYLYDPVENDVPHALAHLERALEEGPFSFHAWMYMGQGYEAMGESARAEAAYEGAIARAPHYFLPQWLYANFLLKRGERARALVAFARAVRMNPEAVANVGELIADPHALLHVDRLADSPAVRARLCAFLLGRGMLPAAFSLWERLEWGEAKLSLARALIAHGIRAGDSARAHAVWQQVREHLSGPTRAREDLLWDGGFERPSLEEIPTRSASSTEELRAFGLEEIPERHFGWRIEGDDQVAVAIVPGGYSDRSHERLPTAGESQEGGHALRLEFLKTDGVRFSGVSQLVMLRPNEEGRDEGDSGRSRERRRTQSGMRYRLRFAYKADVRGDPRLFVEVLAAPRGMPQEDAVLFRWMLPRRRAEGADSPVPPADHEIGRSVLRQSSWVTVCETFIAPPETTLVLLRIRREPAPTLSDFVRGRVWFDAFSLVPEPMGPCERNR